MSKWMRYDGQTYRLADDFDIDTVGQQLFEARQEAINAGERLAFFTVETTDNGGTARVLISDSIPIAFGDDVAARATPR